MKTKYLDWTKMYNLSKLIGKADNYIKQKIRIPGPSKWLQSDKGIHSNTTTCKNQQKKSFIQGYVKEKQNVPKFFTHSYVENILTTPWYKNEKRRKTL